jgi:hypothetical protein
MIKSRCPVHGSRNLGRIVRIRFVNQDRKAPEQPEYDRLLKVYQAQFPRKLDLQQLRKNVLKLRSQMEEKG